MADTKRTSREREITREEAGRFLEKIDPTLQRSLNMGVVRRYANDMDAGKWQPGVAVVAFDKKSRLINGQHVLNALIISKLKSITVIWSLYHDAEAFAGFDKNRKRSAKDDLKIQGVEHPGEVAAVATVLWQWEVGVYRELRYMAGRSGTDFPTAAQVSNVVQTHPGIDNHLWKNPFRGKGFSIGALRAASYILHSLDSKRAEKFFVSLIEGIEIPTKHHPIAVLRKRFLDLGPGERMRTGETLASIFKAWNAYLRGDEISTALLRKGELFPELARRADLKELPRKASNDN